MNNTNNTKNMNHMNNTNHTNHMNHFIVMFVIMIISGLLTTMNIYADKISDLRLSLNDLYMTLLMTGWMFAFMGIFYKSMNGFLIGVCLIIFNIWAIRTQFFITPKQYLLGMIPHHSMAVHMSKKLLEKHNDSKTDLIPFLNKLVDTQNTEIDFMKERII